MKHFYLLFSTLLFILSCKEKDEPVIPDPTPVIHSFNGEIGANDNSTIASVDNNLLFCGNLPNTLLVMKISKEGAAIWRKEFQAGPACIASGIAETSAQEIFVCGSTHRNEANAKADVLLVKLNTNGDTLWTKTYGGSENDFGYYIITTQDGNLLICGSTESYTSDGYKNIYLIKANTNGDTLWTKTFYEPDEEDPYHLLQIQNGEFLVTGTHNVSGAGRELYLLKFSETGASLWNKKMGSPTGKWGMSTIELSNGDLMTCGKITNDTDTQVLLIKTNGVGNAYWEKVYGDTYLEEQGNAMQQNDDGSCIITGRFFESHSGQTQITLLKVDQDGNQLFSKDFGSGFIDYGQNIVKDENDDNLITGVYNGSIFLTRTDNNGVFK